MRPNMPWKKKPAQDKWLEAIENLAKGQRPATPQEHILDFVATKLERTRFIVCADLAVITIADRPNVSNVITNSSDTEAAATRDREIATVLSAVLHANLKADLSFYEASLGIKIVNIEFTKRSPEGPGGIYV